MLDISQVDYYDNLNQICDLGQWDTAARYGLLPPTSHKKRIVNQKGLIIDMCWQYEDEACLPRIFYFHVKVMGIHSKYPVSFMLTADSLFQLLSQISQIQKNGIKDVMIQKRQDEVQSVIMTEFRKRHDLRSFSVDAIAPYQAEIRRKQSEVRAQLDSGFDTAERPMKLITLCEAEKSKDSTWRVDISDGCCLTISYTPAYRGGRPKALPWRLRVEHYRRTDAAMTEPRITISENVYVDVSSEVFFEAVDVMWAHYLAWWRRKVS